MSEAIAKLTRKQFLELLTLISEFHAASAKLEPLIGARRVERITFDIATFNEAPKDALTQRALHGELHYLLRQGGAFIDGPEVEENQE